MVYFGQKSLAVSTFVDLVFHFICYEEINPGELIKTECLIPAIIIQSLDWIHCYNNSNRVLIFT